MGVLLEQLVSASSSDQTSTNNVVRKRGARQRIGSPMKILATFLLLALSAHAAPVSLFDGKSFDGWEGETSKVWRIEEGVIVGGSMEGNPQNEFLATKKSFKNFILKLEYKLNGTEGFVNGGVQFRSVRIPQPPNEMSGYQADIGAGYSGCLYDESRRKKMLLVANKDVIAKAEKPGEWNRYEIRAEDSRIQLFVNGVRTVDYTEREPGIDKEGLIALQIHGKCKAVIAYRNITMEVLADNLVPDEKEVLSRFGNPDNASVTQPAFKDGKFSLADNEVFVFTGQTNLVREQKSGELESILATAYAKQAPAFRHMSWEGDTVYEQWRDLNFGAWKDQLAAAGATIVVCAVRPSGSLRWRGEAAAVCLRVSSAAGSVCGTHTAPGAALAYPF